MKLVSIAVAVVVGFVLLADVGYRYLSQSEFVADASAADPHAMNVSSSVSFPLSYELVAHRAISKVVTSARNVDLGSHRAQRVTSTAYDVHINALSSLTRRTAVVTSAHRVDFAADIAFDQASRGLPAGYTFSYGPDRVVLHGPGGASYVGRFSTRGPASVVFTVPGLTNPPMLTFDGYPFAGCVQGVNVTAVAATITCSKSNPGSDLFPHL